MHILYFISSHGYGHGVRSCAICNFFSDKMALTVRTMLPEQFFKEELAIPFNYTQEVFDCGCIQSDGITVNVRETLQTYMKIADKNKTLLDSEVAWCREHKVSGIVTDIASYPCAVAKEAGIPSVAVSNFSWYDIYKPYLSEMTEFEPYLVQIREQYQMTDLLLSLLPSNAMNCFNRREDIPVVGTKGTNRKKEIKAHYGIEPSKKIGLIYTGNFGMDTIPWKDLEKFSEWEFLGDYPLPGSPANFHLFDKVDFPYQDFIASVDVMIAKIGYGVYSGCICNGIPLLYVPRDNFAEHPVLESAVREWGHGYSVSPGDFYTLKWGRILQEIIQKETPVQIHSNGAQQCARAIESLFSTL